MKKFLSIVSGACVLVGAIGLIGSAGYMEINDITLAPVAYGAIGVALIFIGYRGLKLTGCKYID